MTGRSVWQGAFWLSVGSFVSRLIGAVYRIFLPRVLGDYGVGLFQMAYPLYSILLAVSVNGIPTALAKQMAEKLTRGEVADAERLASWAEVGLGLLGMGLAVGMELSSRWIAVHVFHEPKAVWAMRALAPALAFVALEASFRGYFQGYQNMVPTAVSQILEQLARVMVMFPLAYHWLPNGVDKAAAGATLGAPAGAFVGMLYLLTQRISRKKPHHLRGVPWRDLWRLAIIALPMSLSGLLFPLMLMADSMFVPLRLEKTGLNLYQATAQFGQLSGEAMPLINLTMVVGAALAVSLVPAVARALASQDRALASRRVAQAMHLVWLLGLPMAFGLALLAQPLTFMLYGESGAAPALAVLALGAPVLAMQQILGSSLQAAGYGWVPVKNLIFGGLVKFLATWWLTAIPGLGIRGAAWGTVLSAVTTAYLNWRDWERRVMPGTRPWVTVGWPLVGSVVMMMGIRVWFHLMGTPSATVRSLTGVMVGMVTYGGVVILSGEWQAIRRVLQER